jgi:hypothetical protein
MKPAYLGALVAALAVAACARTRHVETTSSPADSTARAAASPAGAVTWTATLVPQAAGGVAGTATLSGVSAAGQTKAVVTLTGATAGGVHPWHLHAGKCGSNGAIIGPPTAYPAISVGQDGTGKIEATLPFATPVSGSYYVNIHASPADMGTIIACGDFATAGTGGNGR